MAYKRKVQKTLKLIIGAIVGGVLGYVFFYITFLVLWIVGHALTGDIGEGKKLASIAYIFIPVGVVAGILKANKK